jgi:hypothetical protein
MISVSMCGGSCRYWSDEIREVDLNGEPNVSLLVAMGSRPDQ